MNVDTCTVADLDVHLDHIADKVERYLIAMNWGEAIDDTAEATHDLAAAAAEVAAEHPAGTRLSFKYDRSAADWIYTPI